MFLERNFIMNQFYPNPYMYNPYQYNNFPQYQYPFTQNVDQTDEQSYIENILRLNRGKRARFHVTVPGSVEWQDRVFDGIIEQSGKDHIIVSNPNTGEWYLVLMIYLDFVTFEEPINYNKQFYS